MQPVRRPPQVKLRYTDAMLAFFRFLAGIFLLIAVIAAVYDGTRSLAGGGLAMTSLVEHWSTIAPGLLASAQSGVRRATHPLVWDVGVRRLLLVPAWATFARARPALRLRRAPPAARQRVRQLKRSRYRLLRGSRGTAESRTMRAAR